MRGKAFHNYMAMQTKAIFDAHGWQVNSEHRYRKNGMTTYFDLYVMKGNRSIACEIETTSRHAIDNARKAVEWSLNTVGEDGQMPKKVDILRPVVAQIGIDYGRHQIGICTHVLSENIGDVILLQSLCG